MVRGPRSPIRPGEIVKRTLVQRGPQAIHQLHVAYKQVVNEVAEEQVSEYQAELAEFRRRWGAGDLNKNALPPQRPNKRRPMTYHSFVSYIYKLKRLGLVRPIREEPMELFPGQVNPLLSIRVNPPPNYVITSTRVFYDLTEEGRGADDEWLDPVGHFMNRLPPVQVFDVPRISGGVEAATFPEPELPIEGVETLSTLVEELEFEEVESGEIIERELPTEGVETPKAQQVPSIDLPGRFSTRSIPRLLDHFQKLKDLADELDWPDQDNPDLEQEVSRLQEAGEDWRDAAQESLNNESSRDNPREDRLESLEQRVNDLDSYVSALEDQDLQSAIDALEGVE